MTSILNVKLQSDQQKFLEEMEVNEVTALREEIADLRDLMKTLIHTEA